MFQKLPKFILIQEQAQSTTKPAQVENPQQYLSSHGGKRPFSDNRASVADKEQTEPLCLAKKSKFFTEGQIVSTSDRIRTGRGMILLGHIFQLVLHNKLNYGIAEKNS